MLRIQKSPPLMMLQKSFLSGAKVKVETLRAAINYISTLNVSCAGLSDSNHSLFVSAQSSLNHFCRYYILTKGSAGLVSVYLHVSKVQCSSGRNVWFSLKPK